MQSQPFRLFLALFIVFAALQSSIAATPVVHLSAKPAWLNVCKPYNTKIPARNIENGYFFQLVEAQTHVDKQADYRHMITEIVSEAGIQNGSEVTVNFDPSYERLDFHELIVWRNGKPENRLSAGAFKIIADEKELSKFIYQGSYSAFCILNDIRKGDRIEYAYTITGRNPIFNGRFFRDLYFQGSQPIAHMYKSLLVAPAHKLNFKGFNKVPPTVASVKNGLQCYEWDAYQVKPGMYYDNQPGWYNEYAYIQVSDYNSWQEVVNWALKINPLTTNITGNLALKIKELKAKSAGDTETYFRNAVTLVQDEVRYMGIEMGEYSHRANTPERVFNQRYGDCKDKALLLASILNAGGIEAHMVLVNTDAREKTDQFLPSPNVFDHAVMVATVKGKQVWVDATMSYQRGTGTNIYFPNYGKGLVVKAGNNALTTIQPAKAGKTVYKEKYIVTNEKDKVKLEVTSTYTLNEADRMRDRLASASMAETEKNYLEYYTKIYPKIEAVDSVTVADDEIKNEITTVEHYLISNLLKEDSVTGKYKASFYANYIDAQLVNIKNSTKTPLALYYPSNVEYTLGLVMPGGWDIESERQNIKRDAYSLETLTWADADTLLLNYRFSYLKSYLPVNKLDEYRNDVKKMTDDYLAYSIDYTPGTISRPFKLNYWMLALAITAAGLFAFIGFKIYRTPTDEVVFAPGAGFTPIGGWLIVVLVALGISPIAITVFVINTGYFDMNFWLRITGKLEVFSKCLIVFETVGNVFMVCYSVFCFVLLVNRRDILPKYFIGLHLSSLVFIIVDCLLALIIKDTVSDRGETAILRAIIGAVIWISYFKKSTRVERTFIVPYPAHNYSYEQPAMSWDASNNHEAQNES
jgi:transglutaminase-like putative cysteine protease